MNRPTRPFVLLSLVLACSSAGCGKPDGATKPQPGDEGGRAPQAEEDRGDSGPQPGLATDPKEQPPAGTDEPEPEPPKVTGDPMGLAAATVWDHELNYAKRTYVVALEPLPGGGFVVMTQLTDGKKALALTMLDAEGETKSRLLVDPVVESSESDWGSPEFWGLTPLSDTSFALFGDVEMAPTEEEEGQGVKVSGQGIVARIDLVAGEPKTIWSKREPMVRTSDVVVRSDGALAVLGSNAGNTTHLAAYSAQGIQMWRTSFEPVGQRLGGHLVALQGGDLLLAATELATDKWGETGLVMRVDADGTEVWRKRVGNDDKDQVLHHAAPDGDGIGLLYDDDGRYRFVTVAPDGTFTGDVTFGEAESHTPVSFVRTPFGHVVVGGVDTTAGGLQSRHYVLSPQLEVLGHRDTERVLSSEAIALPGGDVLTVAADPGMEAASRIIRLGIEP